MTKTEIAQLCHEFNRLLQINRKQKVSPPWDEAPRWMKDSTINGVEYILRNPGCQASSVHENWRQKKLADGWKLGPMRDDKLKEHPCILPFDKLPPGEQVKDRCFYALVLSLSKG